MYRPDDSEKEDTHTPMHFDAVFHGQCLEFWRQNWKYTHNLFCEPLCFFYIPVNFRNNLKMCVYNSYSFRKR